MLQDSGGMFAHKCLPETSESVDGAANAGESLR